jgi:UDP:flavonoid glycosyltransferase YjiC (YdhE family)
MLGAVAHGLPQLLLPQGADQFANAELLTAAGAGSRLLPGEISSEAIRRGISELLEDATLRAGAVRLRDELDAMPAPGVAIDRIEALVGN